MAETQKQQQQTAIVPRPPTPLDPENLGQAIQLCDRLAASAIVPESLRGKPNDLLVILLTGRDLGLSVAESMRAIYVVKGRPSLASAFKVARAKQHPGCQYFRLVESTPERATWETKRTGDPGPTRLTWTISQAKAAGLTGKGTWAAFPEAMLRWRAASALVDAVFPDAAFGLLPSKEEVEDMAPESPLPRDVTPLRAPEAQDATPLRAPEAQPVEDAEFTEATGAAPEPEPTVNPIAKARGWIAQATTQAELDAVAGLIVALPKEVKAAVRGDFAARKAALATGALATGALATGDAR